MKSAVTHRKPLLTRTVLSVFVVLITTAVVVSCTPTPAAPTRDEAELEAMQSTVRRHRLSNVIPVEVGDYVPIQTGDGVDVNESGRGLLRFSDRLWVEIFRDTELHLSEARLAPEGFIFVRLKQSFGHTQTSLDSLAKARVALETDYATIRATGTKFLVCHGEALTCMVTLEGETEVEAQGEVVVVPAGQATYVLPGEPPKPPIPAKVGEVDEWLKRKRKAEDLDPLGKLVIDWHTAASLPAPDTVTEVRPGQEGMVEIEAGTYTVGVPNPDNNHAPAEQIDLDRLWIDQFEVTNAQYKAFLSETDRQPPMSWLGDEVLTDKEQHPVRGVSWDEAAAYCEWASKRLPTEAEWEIAGRGPGAESSLYPWGDDPLAGGQIDELPRTDTYEIGTKSFNQSPFGVYDMAGNVWEWVGEPYGPVPEGQKILRGGRYGLPRDMAYRQPAAPDDERFVRAAGFRCAADDVQGE